MIPIASLLRRGFPLGALVFGLSPLHAAAPSVRPLIDDFAAAQRHGADRFVVTDKDLGSQSTATQRVEDGRLIVQGVLIPGRGVPAFISVPLLLASGNQPQDASAHTGVRLRVKIVQGLLTIQVATADITNFDYHNSAPLTLKAGEFHDVRVPFSEMKRGWSEQTPLNLKAVTSVNLVSFGLAKGSFAYEVDEISFY